MDRRSNGKLGTNKTLSSRVVSVNLVEPIRAMGIDWPLGRVTDEFNRGLDTTKRCKVQQT